MLLDHTPYLSSLHNKFGIDIYRIQNFICTCDVKRRQNVRSNTKQYLSVIFSFVVFGSSQVERVMVLLWYCSVNFCGCWLYLASTRSLTCNMFNVPFCSIMITESFFFFPLSSHHVASHHQVFELPSTNSISSVLLIALSSSCRGTSLHYFRLQLVLNLKLGLTLSVKKRKKSKLSYY